MTKKQMTKKPHITPNKQIAPKKRQIRLTNSSFKINQSEYTTLYMTYMKSEFRIVEQMIKRIIQLPCCRKYYLKYPLEDLFRAIIKKMMMNCYELMVYSHFLEISQWSVSKDILLILADNSFPDIIHVADPTPSRHLREISMFLYFSSYAVKELLCDNIEVYRKEMEKLFSEFQKLHTHWVNNQPTVSMNLSLLKLNKLFTTATAIPKQVCNYNTCVDKILQISPRYDKKQSLSAQRPPQFGYLNKANSAEMYNMNQVLPEVHNSQQIESMPINTIENERSDSNSYDGSDV